MKIIKADVDPILLGNGAPGLNVDEQEDVVVAKDDEDNEDNADNEDAGSIILNEFQHNLCMEKQTELEVFLDKLAPNNKN